MDKKLVSLFVGSAVATATLCAAAAFAFGSETGNTPPADSPASSVTVEPSTSSSSIAPQAPVGGVPLSTTAEAPAAVAPAPVAPAPATEPPSVTSTGPQAPPVVTTTTPRATTTTSPSVPWCYNPDGKVWYSGTGEGCTPQNPHFVEYR